MVRWVFKFLSGEGLNLVVITYFYEKEDCRVEIGIRKHDGASKAVEIRPGFT